MTVGGNRPAIGVNRRLRARWAKVIKSAAVAVMAVGEVTEPAAVVAALRPIHGGADRGRVAL